MVSIPFVSTVSTFYKLCAPVLDPIVLPLTIALTGIFLRRTLDDNKDTPHLLGGKAAGLTSTVSTMDLKVKKGVMDLKRKLMELGQKKDEL